MKRSNLVIVSVMFCCFGVVQSIVAQSERQMLDTQTSDDLLNPNYSAPSENNKDDVEKLPLTLWPHPYLVTGASAMPGGYAPLAWWGGAGLDLESRHLLADVSALYDNGHKTNDGDQPNPKGHDRYLSGSIYYRTPLFSLPGFFFGGGYGWSQLSTTNYTKGGQRPRFGGGYDVYFDRLGKPECGECWFSARITVNWVMAGSDWQNGSHGPEFSMTLPRPTEKRHVFATWDLGIYRFHTTVTEPSNLSLTQEQRGQKAFDGTSSIGVMYRF